MFLTLREWAVILYIILIIACLITTAQYEYYYDKSISQYEVIGYFWLFTFYIIQVYYITQKYYAFHNSGGIKGKRDKKDKNKDNEYKKIKEEKKEENQIK